MWGSLRRPRRSEGSARPRRVNQQGESWRNWTLALQMRVRIALFSETTWINEEGLEGKVCVWCVWAEKGGEGGVVLIVPVPCHTRVIPSCLMLSLSAGQDVWHQLRVVGFVTTIKTFCNILCYWADFMELWVKYEIRILCFNPAVEQLLWTFAQSSGYVLCKTFLTSADFCPRNQEGTVFLCLT